MGVWQLNDAKNRLSALLEEADVNGPQGMTRHGKERSVLLSIKDYRSLTGKKLDSEGYLLSGPKFDDLTIPRDRRKGAGCAPVRRAGR